MTRPIHRALLSAACVFATLALAHTAHAHFLWLKTLPVPDGAPQVFLFFGESADEEAYHFPAKLASIKIWRRGTDGKRTELASET
jgi:hypothetical protein